MKDKSSSVNPTEANYGHLVAAYDFFNNHLFEGRLPLCLITLQRKARALGFFCGGRFMLRDGTEVTDEIALNPAHFKGQSSEEILSTLVHEMVHLWQHHFGSPSRTGYHNREWADEMERVGLIPSDTARPGGRRIGQRVSHYIEPAGAFERVCTELLSTGVEPRYVEQHDDHRAARKAASKTRYTCPGCGTHAWAKPDTALLCGDCGRALFSG